MKRHWNFLRLPWLRQWRFFQFFEFWKKLFTFSGWYAGSFKLRDRYVVRNSLWIYWLDFDFGIGLFMVQILQFWRQIYCRLLFVKIILRRQFSVSLQKLLPWCSISSILQWCSKVLTRQQLWFSVFRRVNELFLASQEDILLLEFFLQGSLAQLSFTYVVVGLFWRVLEQFCCSNISGSSLDTWGIFYEG